MIILEREDSFIMVTQHEHAQVSGIIAHHWNKEYFPCPRLKQDVELAIYEHDRGWIDLDEDPLWNDQQQRPYSFIDYPAIPKIASYKKGIDEVVQMNTYAGLLCSLHFASFLKDSATLEGRRLWGHELIRQEQLGIDLEITGNKGKEKKLDHHLDILKFCDNLSLYICLNEPGTDKANEHYFYRNGFPQAFFFADYHPIIACWNSMESISLSCSPLETEVQVELPYKEVKKAEIQQYGLTHSYSEAHKSIRKVTIS